MITIKKYPNRRLYNTETSSYINLEGIQDLILEGKSVTIVDSKSNADVTTATLLLHALDSTVIEALIPGQWMQTLMRLDTNQERLEAILEQRSTLIETPEPESETQAEERTHPKVTAVQPADVMVSSFADAVSESSDSDSEVTMVRVDAPPTEPIQSGDADVKRPRSIEVQVTMDAWASTEPPESDVHIPSFWSDAALEDASIELVDSVDCSDETLFEQPEAIVVQNSDTSNAENRSRDGVDNQILTVEESSDEASSDVESSQIDSESSVESNVYSESKAQSDQVDTVFESGESPDVPVEFKELPHVETAEKPASVNKSDAMAAKLAALRAKLGR